MWSNEKPSCCMVSRPEWMSWLLFSKVDSIVKMEGAPILVQEAWSEHACRGSDRVSEIPGEK